MLKGERVILRAAERDDMKRLHEMHRNVDMVIMGLLREEWEAQREQ